jgi:hypothetical protein
MNKVTLHNSNGAEEGTVMGPALNAAKGQKKTYSGTAGTIDGAALVGSFVDVTCTTDAYIRITTFTNPTAATDSDYYVTGGLTYRFPLPEGDIYTVSALRVLTDGTLYVHPVS